MGMESSEDSLRILTEEENNGGEVSRFTETADNS